LSLQSLRERSFRVSWSKTTKNLTKSQSKLKCIRQNIKSILAMENKKKIKKIENTT
jgi:hypothetical protein